MNLDAALAQAARECGLQNYYIDIVRPLLRLDRPQWPSCCGGGCEPCMSTVRAVADRTLQLIARATAGQASTP